MTPDEKIKNIVKNAFKPLCCGVEILDYTRLKFRVFGLNGDILYDVACTPLGITDDKDALRALLTSARSEVENKGVALNPWKLD